MGYLNSDMARNNAPRVTELGAYWALGRSGESRPAQGRPMADGVTSALPVADPPGAERPLREGSGRGVLVDLRSDDSGVDEPAHADRWMHRAGYARRS
jgi:hypothetical protein